MAGLIKSVLIGLIGSLWLTTATVEVPADQPFDVRSHVQAYGEDTSPALVIVPELTNPAEIPLAESKPVSPLIWFGDDVFTTAGLTQPSAPSGSDSMETILEKWLSSVKRFFEGS